MSGSLLVVDVGTSSVRASTAFIVSTGEALPRA